MASRSDTIVQSCESNKGFKREARADSDSFDIFRRNVILYKELERKVKEGPSSIQVDLTCMAGMWEKFKFAGKIKENHSLALQRKKKIGTMCLSLL